MLYNFGYSNCDQPAGRDSMATMQGVQSLLQQLDTAGIAVEQATISIDPARDTPERLQRFAQELGADPATWHFLTGEAARLKNVVGGGFGVFYEPTAGEQSTWRWHWCWSMAPASCAPSTRPRLQPWPTSSATSN